MRQDEGKLAMRSWNSIKQKEGKKKAESGELERNAEKAKWQLEYWRKKRENTRERIKPVRKEKNS